MCQSSSSLRRMNHSRAISSASAVAGFGDDGAWPCETMAPRISSATSSAFFIRSVRLQADAGPAEAGLYSYVESAFRRTKALRPYPVRLVRHLLAMRIVARRAEPAQPRNFFPGPLEVLGPNGGRDRGGEL